MDKVFFKIFKHSVLFIGAFTISLSSPLLKAQEPSLLSKEEQIILEALREAVWGEVRTHGPLAPLTPPPPSVQPTLTIPPTPTPSLPTNPHTQVGQGKGQEMVERIKAQNREILKQRQRTTVPSGDSDNFHQSSQQKVQNFLSQSRASTDQQLQEWKTSVQQTYQSWNQEREKFLKQVGVYQKGLSEMLGPKNLPKEIPAEIQQKEKAEVTKVEEILKKQNTSESPLTPTRSETPSFPSFHVVKEAFSLPVRDQGERATCSAFAGIRGLEILLAQKGKRADLSPHFFYWATKPNCQHQPCSTRGSWVIEGLLYSQKQPGPTIPLEEQCSYQQKNIEGNETHLPLPASCSEGVVKVGEFERLLTVEDVHRALSQDWPVVAPLKLSANFFKNQGFVSFKDAHVGEVPENAHAKGHAMLLVGYLELPADLWTTEGKNCYIGVNSWGEGFGRGGYVCLSETWLKAYRHQAAFIGLKSVETTL